MLLSAEGVHRGHDRVRKLAGVLRSYGPAADYSYDRPLVAGDIAMMQWTGNDEEIRIDDGADSYV